MINRADSMASSTGTANSGAATPGLTANRLRQYELLTPENVTLSFDLADVGLRFGAVVLDYGFILIPIILGAIAVDTFSLVGLDTLWQSIFILAAFLLRNAYFPWFEIKWQGRTPGKKITKTRVIARDGGPLTPGMVFARNLTRELELFIPLTALFAPQSIASKVPGWLIPISLLWVAVIVFLPLANRQNARLGDLLAGTLVVLEPRQELLPDLIQGLFRSHPTAADMAKTRSHGSEKPNTDDKKLSSKGSRNPHFTEEQLAMYGIHELQILEDILRRDLSPQTMDLMSQITDRIQRKIAWEPPPDSQQRIPPVVFLKAFYGAQRGHLEHKMLLGQRRESKRIGKLERQQADEDPEASP